MNSALQYKNDVTNCYKYKTDFKIKMYMYSIARNAYTNHWSRNSLKTQ